MIFEEEFPSLKDLTFQSVDEIENLSYGEVVFIEDIREHCLDKQRVKKAINKILNYANMKYANGDFMIEHNIRIELIYKIEELKKELGLED